MIGRNPRQVGQRTTVPESDSSSSQCPGGINVKRCQTQIARGSAWVQSDIVSVNTCRRRCYLFCVYRVAVTVLY